MRRRTIKKVKEKEIENHSLLFFATPSSDTLLILNEGRTLTVESNPADWLNVTVDNARNGIIVLCNQNTSTGQRNGVIVVSDAVKEYRISVSQYGVVTVIPDTLSFSSDSSSQTFQILGGCGSFTITPGSFWISISGTGRNRSLTVEANQSAERSASVTITDISTHEIVFLNIVQEKVEYTPMSISPDTLSFSKAGATQSATLTGGDGNYTITTSDSWISAYIQNRIVYITVETNPTIDRKGMITIKDGTGASVSLSLKQEGMTIREWVHSGGEYYDPDLLQISNNINVTIQPDYVYHIAEATTSLRVLTTSLGLRTSAYQFNGLQFNIYRPDGSLVTTNNSTLNTNYTYWQFFALSGIRENYNGEGDVYTANFYSTSTNIFSLGQPNSVQTIMMTALHPLFQNPYGLVFIRLVIDDWADSTLSYGINIAIRCTGLDPGSWITKNVEVYRSGAGSLTTHTYSTIMSTPSLSQTGLNYFAQARSNGQGDLYSQWNFNFSSEGPYENAIFNSISVNGATVNGRYSNGAFNLINLTNTGFGIQATERGALEAAINIIWNDYQHGRHYTDTLWLSWSISTYTRSDVNTLVENPDEKEKEQTKSIPGQIDEG